MFSLISKFYQLNMFVKKENISCDGVSWKHVCWINRGITKQGTRVSRSPYNQVTSGIKSPQPWPTVPKTSVLDSVSFNYFTFFHHCFYPDILQVYKYALYGFNRHLQMNNGFPSHTPSEWSPPPTWRQEKDWTKDSDCQLCLRFGVFIWEWNFHCDSMRSCSEGWSSAYIYANIHLTWRSHSPP